MDAAQIVATGPVSDRYEGLELIDHAVVVVYLAGLLLLGYFFSRRLKTKEEYFLAGRRMPWFAVGLSIMATLMSTITYLSTPGEMIKHGMGASAMLLSYPLVLVVVGYLVIPYFMRLNVTSAYEYLEQQFDLAVRLFAASLFVLVRLAWMGVIVYTAAGPLATISGFPFLIVVLGVTVVGIAYTVLGGLRAVIWTDVLQFIILFVGAVMVIVYVAWDTGTGFETWWADIMTADTEPQPVFSFDPRVRLTVVGMICWTLFWWICTASSDQVVVQRYLSTGSTQAARRSFACNVVANVVTTLLLCVCGIALYSYYKA